MIIGIGLLGTGAAIVWVATLRDEHGDRLIDTATSAVLVALLGTAGTILGLVLQRTGEVRHQVQNDHGTNFRDDLDDTRSEIAAVRDIAEHAVRAAQKGSDDTVQLREDVQQLREDLGGTQSDIRGIRRDIGRLTNHLTQKES
ncbi:DUF2746 domain-containing protein [Microbacterium sp. NIBRBAC000506063]|uniref:DUF2746 domain-containing protein n=1 Tax=Microbacterium sp. NIBRBAC000506063 TaxID=2734618 RepID=UPI001BB54790|nr:DUF2746 domain-containing protein [Microbacterium sp. NIBRBAC000506063]QTV79495.1 DUF2746 domain-containing protein [Microbacterium sp. NIBRBAC000506063]